MKILLDHDLPKRLQLLFKGHLALKAKQMSWHELSNGRLIAAADVHQFDILIAADKKMCEQQKHLDRTVSLIVLSTSLMGDLEPNFSMVIATVERSLPGGFEAVEIPEHGAESNSMPKARENV